MKLNIFNSVIIRQLFIALCLNIGQIMTGFSVSWSAPAVLKLQDIDQTPLPDVISITEASWVGSCFNVGVIVGPSIVGYLANLIGRKPCLMIGSAIMLIGQIVLTLARSLVVIFVGRLLLGFGGAFIVVVNIIYIGEMASPSIRGIILTSTGVFHTFGCLVAYSVGPFVSYSQTSYVFFCVAALHLIGCFLIPESPVYLLLKGKDVKATEIFNNLGRGKDIDELKDSIENSQNDQKQDWKWHELVTVKCNRKSFIIALPALFFQQCCGILAVLFFTTTIFQNASSSIKPEIASIITGATQFLGTLIVPSLIENAGRKTLLLLSTTGCGITMAIMGVYFYLELIKSPVVATIGWLPLASIMVSIFCFSIGLNIVPNTLIGELFAPNVRSIGSSLTMVIGNTMGFVGVTSFGYIVKYLGSHVVFFIYTAVNIVGFIYTLRFIPETKGKSLPEIQAMLEK